ncbi:MULTISPECIES: HNH endonuclease signature motif containing protein [unclassified Nocardiopsis]|uniref:HNH endonuclease signature motif containing protein n=1 Tax=Nocardiopsis TaxID=2013 RepID=UPI00387B23AE
MKKAQWLTHACRIPARQAADLYNLARTFSQGRLPATEAAFHDGTYSLDEAVAVVKATDKAVEALEDATFPDGIEPLDPDRLREVMEADILATRWNGGVLSVAQIGRHAARLQAALLPDRLEDDHARAHAERGARLDITPNGKFLFSAWGSAADAARLQACLDSYTLPPEEGTLPGDERSRQRRVYDAFLTAMDVAHTHHACTESETPVVRLQVTVPDTVLAGDPTTGEAATTDTGQPLPVSVLREWLTRGTLRPLAVTKDGVVTHVGEERRMASPGMRAAAFARHTTCAWPSGCDRPLRHCQADHIVEFFQGGPTRADNLQPLCSAHNRLKHQRSLARARRRHWTPHPVRAAPQGFLRGASLGRLDV